MFWIPASLWPDFLGGLWHQDPGKRRVSQIQMVPPKDLLTVSKQLERQLFRVQWRDGFSLSVFFFFFFFFCWLMQVPRDPAQILQELELGKWCVFQGPRNFSLFVLLKRSLWFQAWRAWGLEKRALIHSTPNRDASQESHGASPNGRRFYLPNPSPGKDLPQRRNSFCHANKEQRLPAIFWKFCQQIHSTAWNMGVDLGRGGKSPPSFTCQFITPGHGTFHFSRATVTCVRWAIVPVSIHFGLNSQSACLSVNETQDSSPETCKVHFCDFACDLVRGSLILKSDSDFSLVKLGWCTNSVFPVIPVASGEEP